MITGLYCGLVFAGVSSIALGVFHMPQIWGAVFRQWNADVTEMSLLNRKLIHTLLIALGLTLIILGVATILLIAGDPAPGAFRTGFYFCCALFWAWRLGWQILYFPYRRLNPSRPLLVLHLFLIAVFLVNAVAYSASLIAMIRAG